jgi:succinate dehydrogenase / fumarate reductase, cytochrome b subunit
MGANAKRPLSPHLGIYRRSPAMMVSIIHRITGFIMATAGMMALLWWLSAIAGGPESYASFQSYAISGGETATTVQMISNWFFRLLAIAVTYSFFQHLFSGLRHLVMDMGAGFELNSNRTWTWAVFIAAFFATAFVALLVAWRYSGI